MTVSWTQAADVVRERMDSFEIPFSTILTWIRCGGMREKSIKLTSQVYGLEMEVLFLLKIFLNIVFLFLYMIVKSFFQVL